ncbi:MAG: S26 family signal peptidase [Proteobacteria bacterium]|nr:MAG: S26 family signal peptidase [Pseudomonadota bacterium]PIE64810.1 MAG: S26 family signal peptidase [Desulfobacterales bacterium]
MLVQLDGHSMFPTFRDGDILDVDTDAYLTSSPRIGDVVLADHPFIKNCYIIKRVHDITKDDRLILHGDSTLESTDSRSFGSVALKHIRGRVVARQ